MVITFGRGVSSMKQVIRGNRKKSSDRQKIAVLQLELNYELAVLFEAMQDNNEDLKAKTIRKLEHIREQLINLGAL